MVRTTCQSGRTTPGTGIEPAAESSTFAPGCGALDDRAVAPAERHMAGIREIDDQITGAQLHHRDVGQYAESNGPVPPQM
ncbi:hypothetical protein ABH941_004378 [Streptacidiphilus sp. EB103A]